MEQWREAVGGRAGERLAQVIAKIEARDRGQGVEVAGKRLRKLPAPCPAQLKWPSVCAVEGSRGLHRAIGAHPCAKSC